MIDTDCSSGANLPMNAKPSLNADMLEELRELLEDKFGELVQRFSDDGERRIQRIRDAIQTDSGHDFDVIYAEAHGLKGSGRNMGADPLGDICEQLETKGRAADSENMEPIFAALEQEFATVCRLLNA